MTDHKRPPHRSSGKSGQPKGQPMNVDRIAITEEDLRKFDEILPGISDYIRGWAAKAQNAETEARTDPLTGLPNRLGLEEQMGGIMKEMVHADKRNPAKAKACSLVFIDTNDFGLINKAMGDSAGDLAIQAVGEYFEDTLRKGDFVARKGGDEFVIAMRCPKEDAEKRLHELKKDFNDVATKNFRRKLTELIASQYEDMTPLGLRLRVEEQLLAFQQKLAVKHGNEELSKRDFSLSFSFGVREVSKEEAARIDLNSSHSVAQAMGGLMSTADEMMRDDKDAYRSQMASYTAPERMAEAAKARLLRDLSHDPRSLS